MVTVREAGAGEWELLREVRLAALSEAPQAFGSTYAREASFGEQEWRSRLSSPDRVTFFAETADDTVPAGLAGAYTSPDAASLVSMWVRPPARGQGAGAALVAAAAAWATSRGHRTLQLWVTETNTPARMLYERCGFTPTGQRQPLPSDPAQPEIQMQLLL